MSDNVGQIALDLGINYNGFNKQLSGIAGNATNMVGSAFKKLGGIVATAFAVGKLVEFGKSSIELASNLTEVQNVVDVTFGSMAADINNWSKTALQQFGLSELSAKKYSSTMGAMMKSSGLAGVQMEGMAKKLTELSADMASFYNLSNDMAFEKIRSGISGETEPLKQLGINMSVANMEAFALTQGIKKQYQQMTQAEQTLLRYNYLLSVSKDAQGDFARTSGSWANQVKLLGEQWKIFQGTMGAGLINMLAPVIRGLNFLIAKLQIAAQYFKAFTSMLFGDASGGSVGGAADAAAASTDAMGGAVADAGKATKKAGKDVKGALGGFDQLNTLTQAAASSASDAASGISDMGSISGMGDMNLGGNIDLGIDESKIAPLKTALDGLKTAAVGVKDYFETNFGPVMSTAIDKLKTSFAGWKTSFGETFTSFKTLGEPLKQWFMGDFTTQVKTGIGVMGTVLSGLLDTGRIVFDGIRGAAEPIILWFVENGLPMLSQFGTEAALLFQTLFDNAKRIFDTIWSEGVQPGLDLLSHMILGALDIIKGFWDTWGVSIFDKLKELVKNLTDTITNFWDKFLQPVWSNIVETLKRLWDEHLKGMFEELGNFIGKLITGVLDIYNKFISPIINYLVDVLSPGWKATWDSIVAVFETIVGTISDVISGLLKSLGGIVDFIAGVFTGDWKKAWNGIKDIFDGIVDGIKAIFKGAINLIIDLLNTLIRHLNTIHFEMPDWSPIMPGKSFGINIPVIPKLANGGLVSAPTLAMVGDNRNAAVDPEVVSPLSKLQDMIGSNNQPMINLLAAILEELRKGATPPVIKVGETEFARVSINAINNLQRQAGRTLLTV